MLKTSFLPYQLQLKRPSGTSRGVLTTKDTWLINKIPRNRVVI